MSKNQQLQDMKQALALGGGQKRIDAQHGKGKFTARERLALLFDENSFVESGAFVKHRCTDFNMETTEAPGDGVVTGYGKVDGKVVYAFAQDFTILGGTLGEAHAEKIAKVQDQALRNGCPIVGLFDSGGARIQEGVYALDGFGKIFYRNTISSGVIPQISAIMGPCAGGAVYSPAITDFIFMVNNTANMFITGPDVIKSVTGESVSFEELGGAKVHNAKSGVAHFISDTEADCIGKIRQLLSYLPSNNMEYPAFSPSADPPDRLCPELDDFIPDSPKKPYDMYTIIHSIVDNGEIIDVQPVFAQNIITCFAKMCGKTIGIVANQPKILAGCIDVNASDKAARFIRRCDAFNIPLLTLVDVPGFLPGSEQEHNGIIRHGAKMLYAYSEATVPKTTVVIRKAYGGAYIAMCCKALGADHAVAWPTAEIAVMGAEGAANIIFRKEIAAAEDPEQYYAEKTEEYRNKFSGPYKAAELGYIDDVILPSETRRNIIKALEVHASKRMTLPLKKHGNIPL